LRDLCGVKRDKLANHATRITQHESRNTNHATRITQHESFYFLERSFLVKEFKAPQGTLALMALFALLTLAFWANAYFTVLSRGVTQ
jgi:hypothetical protein